MSLSINKQAYTQLIEEDLKYLNQHCEEGSPEKDHIRVVLCNSIGRIYSQDMNAIEAKKISESNQLTVTQALERIKNAASHGDTTVLFSNIHEDSIHVLIQKGYRISKFTDSIGLTATRVEW